MQFPAGLSSAEAAALLAREGYNELAPDQRRPLWKIVVDVAREPMFLLLLAAGGIYFAMGDGHEAAVLLGFVAITIGVTVVQEQRTEKALQALRDLSSPRALVMRDGAPLRIAGREVVLGDIVMLAEGDRIPADGVLLEAHDLAVDESLLTGESAAIAKFAQRDDGIGDDKTNPKQPFVLSEDEDLSLNSHEDSPVNNVFAGTLAVRGQGLMRVTATGGKTEMGRIGKSLGSIVTERSPLQREIGKLTQRLAIIGILLCALTVALYATMRGSLLKATLAGITLAMSILPEEFPVILIVFFALGARRIARERVLTRKLSAIETLGAATVLCVDKTGTLTENRMALVALVVEGQQLDVVQLTAADPLPEAYHKLLEYLVLASEIEPHDPMEQAFHNFASDYLAGTGHLHPEWNLAREYELSSELLAMSHLWQATGDEPHVVATKGAPEAIADLCHLPPAERDEIAAQSERLAAQGLRVLGVAEASHRGEAMPAIQHDFDFRFIGLVGLADPLRAEAAAAVAECRRAGIRVVMITGDHPRTAQAIAAQAGIDHAAALTGVELAALPQEELAQRIRHVSVFARVTPRQKLLLVDVLCTAGEVVAMTGDGVNDAPALKAAHIGIAMGKRGTDVAREAASLVLLDDDFTAIVSAVRLGRRIFANLRQALIYTLAVHVPIIALSMLPLLFGWPLVLMPAHIALLELVINPSCSIVFEAEPGARGLMERPPRSRQEPLISGAQFLLALLQGTLASAAIVGMYWFVLRAGIAADEARTLAFIALIASNGALILSSLGGRVGVRHLFSGISRTGVIVLGVTFSALVAVTVVPVFAELLRFSTPGIGHWLSAFALGLGCLILFEVAKVLVVKIRI